MPTKHPRINVTLDEENLGLLSRLARKRKKSLSAAAKDLILEAMELQEDLYFSRLADGRLEEMEKTKATWIPHEEAWK